MSAFVGTGQNDAGIATFELLAALPQYSLVMLTATEGQVQVAGGAPTTDIAIGVTARGGVAGEKVPVILLNKQGTIPMIASAALATVGAPVFLVAAGQIGATAANTRIGVLLKAATGANHVVAVLPFFTPKTL